jgi:UDP-N-acetylmuramyl pentapeptide phosphotransferase/UDP-N-acetylglucosamine-1-phosphate transferase
MFFVGLKDDIVTLSAGKKLMAQILTACIIIFFAKIRFTNLHGFLGIGEIGMVFSVLLTGFVIIVLINSFNLMDGIDGLAGGLTMLAALVFGTWFYLSGHFEYAILSVSLIGAIGGFFYFNVYGDKNRIFMGDTGSLVLGTIMSVIVIRFNEFNIDQSQPFAIASTPAVSFGILLYPLADTIRVMIIRILHRKSPFTADKNHLHHRLLALGFSHKKATYTIVFTNLIFMLSVIAMQRFGILQLMLYILCVGSTLFMIPAYMLQRKNLIQKDDPHQQLLIPGQAYEILKAKRYSLKVAQRSSPLHPTTLQEFFQKLNLW